MKLIVGTAPVEIPRSGRGRPVIQNLGPGSVYLDTEGTVTADTGLRIAEGGAFEFDEAASYETGVWLVGTDDVTPADVRVITMGA